MSSEPGAARPEAARDWRLLALATLGFGIGFGIYQATAPVYAAQQLGLAREQLGRLEGLREVPGFLTAGMMALVAAVALPRLAAVALLIAGAGFAATGAAGAYLPLIAANVLWSIGLHVWLTVQPTLVLSLTREGRHGLGLGTMSRYLSVAIMAGLALVWLLSVGGDRQNLRLGYGGTLLLAGLCTAAGGIAALRVSSADRGQRERLVFRRDYWRYYLLMLLDGGRRQIVQTFAVLILIKEYQVGVGTVAVLLLLNNLLTMAAAPVVGSWTDRHGERRVLAAYYAFVVLVFSAYTQVPLLSGALGLAPAWVFAAIYCADNLLFTGSVGIQTYIRHTAREGELSPSLAMGLTWNHVAAVLVPILAGEIWARFGYERIFVAGACLAVVSVLTSLNLPRPVPAAT